MLPWLLQIVQAAFGKPVHNVKYLTTSYDHARQRHALSAAARPTEIDRKACRPRLWPLPVDRLAEKACRSRHLRSIPDGRRRLMQRQAAPAPWLPMAWAVSPDQCALGRASCRERLCQSVSHAVVAVSLQQNQTTQRDNP